MRHFEGYEQAKRYHAYRPKIHPLLIPTIKGHLELVAKVPKALDIGCGTGHSTIPLLKLADEVIGVDLSPGMLRVAKEQYPNICFQEASAEQTGLASQSINLITCSMAFHWFDIPAFLKEVIRIAKPGAYFCVYNLWFPGEMKEKAGFQDWYLGAYRERFPTPARNPKRLEELIAQEESSFSYLGNKGLHFNLDFSLEEVLAYLCTQSNITSAISKGEKYSLIEKWLKEQLSPFFGHKRERFAYRGLIEFAQIN